MTLSEFRTRFDPLLLEFVQIRRQRLPALTSTFLQELIAYPETLLGDGKRIRPYLGSLMYLNLSGSVTDDVLRFFAAFELFHLFCLIHDDIIDKGETRHGVQTLHRYTKTRFLEEKRIGSADHIGDSQALLIGDLLFSWSIETAERFCPGTTRARTRVRDLFFQMIDEVVIGQMLDVDLSTRSVASDKEILQKMFLKTASYTFVKPLQVGASIQTSSLRVQRFCERFGTALGLAFQWQDDLLDLMGNSEDTKKTSFSDLLTRQQTPFTQHVRMHGSSADRAEFEMLLGRPLSVEEQARVRQLLELTGAIQAGEAMIARYFTEAETLVQRATFLTAPEAFIHLITRMRGRSS